MKALVFGLTLIGLAVALPGDAVAQQAPDRDGSAVTLHIGADGVARLVPASGSSSVPVNIPLPDRRGDDGAQRAGGPAGDGPWNRGGRDGADRDGGPPPFVGDLLSTVLGGIFGGGGLLSSLPIPGNR